MRALIILLCLSIAQRAGGQELIGPPKLPPKLPPEPPQVITKIDRVNFVVGLAPEALKLERESLPGQFVLTHVRLEPESGEAVFYTDAPGMPRLPRLARFVALPPDAVLQSVRVTPVEQTTIPDVRLLGWAQLAQPGQNPQDPKNRYATPPIFPLDDQQRPVFYPPVLHPPDPGIAALKVYPEDSAMVVSVESRARRAVGVLRLDVAPVQWDIAKGELNYATKLEVSIDYVARQPIGRPKTAAEGAMLDDIRDIVVNPGDIPPFVVRLQPPDVPYLIITDDNFWTETGISMPGANLVAEFQRLADWKTAKGVRAAVVRISDIVSGVYGDFSTGAADLQETIRAFLKSAERANNTQWVLLGGDIEVIPPRKVAVWGHANAAHYIQLGPDSAPKVGRSYWDAGAGKVRLNTASTGFTHMLSPRTGKSFTAVVAPSMATPGWKVVANALCDMTGAPPAARCIELGGDPADIENTHIALVLGENVIPTDLYYASVVADSYDVPGQKDWDANGDGLYGTNLWASSADGVSYASDFALGRASVTSTAQAQAFVDKVIAYEKYEAMPAGFGRRLLLGSDNWGGGPGVSRTTTDNPPPAGKYYHAFGSSSSVLHFSGAPGAGVDWQLVSWNSAGDWDIIPYDLDAGPGVPGYYFCTTIACTVKSSFPFPLLFFIIDIPVPTQFVKVFGTEAQLSPTNFFFDSEATDGSALEKEEVKNLFAARLPAFTERRRLYKDIFDMPPAPDLQELSAARMQTALNQGYNVVSLSGHGWWGGCCGVGVDYANLLTNGAAGGVIYADSCLTNQFDVDNALSETMLITATGGSAAYVGNARFSWIGLGAPYERQFWNRLRTTRHVGRLHNTKWLNTAGPNEQWVNFSLNLQGDPEMEIWRGEPRRMTLQVPITTFLGSSITARVLNPDGSPVWLARVTLTGPGGVFQIKHTDPTGRVTFTPAGRAGESLMVTATHTLLEYVPEQAQVSVMHRLLTGPPGLGFPGIPWHR